jgi:hypothetical protein
VDLDADCLRWARVENLERLAVSLRVPLPIHKRGSREAYHRALVRSVVAAIDPDREYAAMAEQTRPEPHVVWAHQVPSVYGARSKGLVEVEVMVRRRV